MKGDLEQEHIKSLVLRIILFQNAILHLAVHAGYKQRD